MAKASIGHSVPNPGMAMAIAAVPVAPPMPWTDLQKLPCSRAVALPLSQNAWLPKS